MRKPWLWLPAELAHDVGPFALKAWSSVRTRHVYDWQPLKWRQLEFKNRLGIAGGVDKNATAVSAWWTFGPGFLEVGTVTPQPQRANPGKIIARDLVQQNLWNCMGFPNHGAAALASRLEKLRRPYFTPLFVNIGKNRDTDLTQADEDYAKCVRELRQVADAFVINVSSPNTVGLRSLQSQEHLEKILLAVHRENQSSRRPILLKASPDMSDEELSGFIETSLKASIDGWIFTNTTQARSAETPFPSKGGVSGRFLAPYAQRCQAKARDFIADRKGDRLLISTGGVMSATDTLKRLSDGADLVQVYSALVFHGPGFFATVDHEIRDLLNRS